MNSLVVTNMAIILSALTIFLFPLCNSYHAFVIMSLLFGLFVGEIIWLKISEKYYITVKKNYINFHIYSCKLIHNLRLPVSQFDFFCSRIHLADEHRAGGLVWHRQPDDSLRPPYALQRLIINDWAADNRWERTGERERF